MKKISSILVVTSTKIEVSVLERKLTDTKSINSDVTSYKFNDLDVDILISGVGIPQVMYRTFKRVMQKKYDLVLNIGICGSFNEDFLIGDTVSVILDEFADIGITESDNSFKTLAEEELIKPNLRPFKNGKLYHTFQKNIDTSLPKVTSITVNTTSGSKGQILMRKEKFQSDIETMEGAAVAYICLMEKINFLQIRSISNYVEPRNRDNWDVELAVNNLSLSVIDVLARINK